MSISVQQALQFAHKLQMVSDSAGLETELLLGHVLDKSREYLRAHGEIVLSDACEQQFRALLARREAGEPVAYILGKQAFWDFDLIVNGAVLIPRPETELLVELSLKKLEQKQLEQKQREQKQLPVRVADLGTGSGAIAIALARNNPQWQIDAVDISEDALGLAQQNASDLGVNNIEFRYGSWCDGLADELYDLIVANPPYVEPGDKHLAEGDLPFEPLLALVADEKGFAAHRSIMADAKRKLKKDAWLLMEHGYNQQEKLIEMLEAESYSRIVGHKDYASVDRIVEACWSEQI